MAVLAQAQITVSRVVDISSVTRYYLLQSSTASAPSKPTANPPGGNWSTTEPTYTTGSTNTLYFVDLTVFTNNTFSYSAVSKSSSYEAAKAAYNKAVNAESTANNAQNDIDNLNVGARNYFIRGNLNNLALGSGVLLENVSYVGFSFPVLEGEEWTFYRTDTTNNRWRLYWFDTEPIVDAAPVSNPVNADEQIAYVVNKVTVPSGITWGFFYLSNQADDIPNIMLEKGNHATDWTPAPEDIESGISDAATNASDAQSKAEGNSGRLTDAESTIKKLVDSISMIVTDENGTSLFEQTSDGFSFNMYDTRADLEKIQTGLNNLSKSNTDTNNLVSELQEDISNIESKTAYVNIGTDGNNKPCIELGEKTSDFKVRITNTSIDFLEGTSRVAWIEKDSLSITIATIKDELIIQNEQDGTKTEFVWGYRGNGNFGLQYRGGAG